MWGDDPALALPHLRPDASGLIQVNVRVSVPGEGPRAVGKVVRWNRVQVGELAVEIQGGHRLVTFQVETQVLNGVDDVGDAIGAFARAIFAAVDGRTGSVRRPAIRGRLEPGRRPSEAAAGLEADARPSARPPKGPRS